MPIYRYKYCNGAENAFIERNVPIDERDNQTCDYCGLKLTRIISFTGSVYAPTAGGMK